MCKTSRLRSCIQCAGPDCPCVYVYYSPCDSNHYKPATKPLPVLTSHHSAQVCVCWTLFRQIGLRRQLVDTNQCPVRRIRKEESLSGAKDLEGGIIVRCEGFGRRNYLDGLTFSKIWSAVEWKCCCRNGWENARMKGLHLLLANSWLSYTHQVGKLQPKLATDQPPLTW